MKPIMDFMKRFNSSLLLDEKLVVAKRNRYFLVNNALKRFVKKDFYYAGAPLGKVKRSVFFPSFILLSLMAQGEANKTIVDSKAAWLYVCGRDVFKRGIVSTTGSKRKGDYTLIMNQRNECLGFGKIIHNLEEVKDRDKVVVKNISDIGDFLRREKRSHQTTK